MATDKTFIATGPGSTGFKTEGEQLDIGANFAGNTTGGQFTVLTQGPQNAAVYASSPAYGRVLLAGDSSQDARDGPDPCGVYAESAVPGGVGVQAYGQSQGVAGYLFGSLYCAGALATQDADGLYTGVLGQSSDRGVEGVASGEKGIGVLGKGQVGVLGESATGNAIVGYASHAEHASLMTVHTGGGAGLWAESNDGHGNNGLAAHFQGSIEVTKDVTISGNVTVQGDVVLFNRDLAERFPSVGEAAPGIVMVIGEDGALRPSEAAYDTRVVGVVTGAGSLRPAITLGADLEFAKSAAIALVGTAYCLAEGPVAVGDLLVTSSAPGCAMAAHDATRRSGAVIGKALGRLAAGESGLVPIVIALQ